MDPNYDKPSEPLACRTRQMNGAVFRKNRGPVSQRVWHYKDPSLLKGRKRRAKAQILHLHQQCDVSLIMYAILYSGA